MSTAAVGNILLDKEILLESGTNELEVLVFVEADFTFGINVAKVREVLLTTQSTNLPKAHASVRGVFKLRDLVAAREPRSSLSRAWAPSGGPREADLDRAGRLCSDWAGSRFHIICISLSVIGLRR